MELQKLWVTLAMKMQEYTQGLTSAVGQAEGFRGRVEDMFGRIGKAAKLAMAGVGAAVAAGFALAVKSSIDVNAQLETTTLQFETLMGDADQAAEHVAGLFKFAERTPFETGPIIEASLKLQTFGGEALNTEKNLYLLGDAAAATNAPIDELGFWVGRLYANLEAGQPFGEAAMRLQELAVMSPQARSEMEALQQAGASAQEIFAYFQEDLEKFGGAMEKQASTWQGMTSTIKDQIQLLIAGSMKQLFENGKAGLSELIKLLNNPDIVNGIKAMGAELGKVADTFFRLTGSVLNYLAAVGQMSENRRVVEDLNLSLEETRELTYQIQEQLGVGFFMTQEEQLAVQVAVNEELERRYQNELMFVDGLNARSEAEDWANQVSQETAAVQEQVAAEIQNVTGAVMGWRTQAVLMSEHTKELDGNVKSATAGLGPLTAAVAANAEAYEYAAGAMERFSEAFQSVLEDYTTRLPGADNPLVSPAGLVTTITGGLEGGQLELLNSYKEEIAGLQEEIFNLESGLGTYGQTQDSVNEKIAEARGELAYYQELMAPLAAQTGVASTSQVGLRVNVDAVKQAVFDQLVQMNAAPEVITAYGVAIGVMTQEQADAALMAAAVAVKVQELAKAMADPEIGMSIDEANRHLMRFIDQVQNGVIPAADAAATDVPAHFNRMRIGVGEEALATGQALMDGISDGILENQQTAIDTASLAAEEVIAGTNRVYGVESPSTVFAGIGRNLMEGLSGGIAELVPRLVTEVTGIGGQVIDGIIAGIEAGKEALRGVLSGVADLIPDWLKQFLGIASPAQATIPVGQAVAEGVATGIYMNSYVIETAAYDLSQIIVGYLQGVIEEGYLFNEWFMELPEDMRPTVMQIGALIAEGNEAIANYFQFVIEEGDPLNDFLASVPEEFRDMVQEIGEALADGLDDVVEYVVGIDQILRDVGELLDVGSRFGNLGRGFAGHFKRQVLEPMENQMETLSGTISAAGEIYETVFRNGKFADDMTLKTLNQLLSARARLTERIRDYESRGVSTSAYMYEIQSLETVNQAVDAFRLRNDINAEYIRQQEKLLALEKARADLDFLKQQMELLELVRANNIPITALSGVEFGLTADPGQMMELMVDVTERLVRQMQYELNSLNQSPAVTGQTPGTDRTTMNIQTQNINGGQHIYLYDVEESELERLGILSR